MNQLIHGMWEEYLPKIDDASVDLIIIDPPYYIESAGEFFAPLIIKNIGEATAESVSLIISCESIVYEGTVEFPISVEVEIAANQKDGRGSKGIPAYYHTGLAFAGRCNLPDGSSNCDSRNQRRQSAASCSQDRIGYGCLWQDARSRIRR